MYGRLEAALSRLLRMESESAAVKGVLGYTVDGAYAVSVAENPAKYYVRLEGGSFAQVYHRGRVAPVPDLPVEVGHDSAGNLVILGGDAAQSVLYPGAFEVGPHSHARGSGMEFPVDARLLTPLKAAPLEGLTVEVAEGAYWHGCALRWWSGGSITLTPLGSANEWAWIVIGLDAAAGELISASGAVQVVSAPLDVATIPAIGLGGAIPLAAVRVANGQTELDEDDFEDLRFVPGGRGSGYVLVREELAQGTDGGTFTSGAWQTRALNSEAADSGDFADLSSNQITLEPGTYRLRASAPAFAVGAHQARWQNISDGVTVLMGTTEQAVAEATRSMVSGRFVVEASTVFELQHCCASTGTGDGFGAAANFAAEVYAEVELWRE
jgi:hypothetical protein